MDMQYYYYKSPYHPMAFANLISIFLYHQFNFMVSQILDFFYFDITKKKKMEFAI